MPDTPFENALASFAMLWSQAGGDLCYFLRVQAMEEPAGPHEFFQRYVVSMLINHALAINSHSGWDTFVESLLQTMGGSFFSYGICIVVA